VVFGSTDFISTAADFFLPFQHFIINQKKNEMKMEKKLKDQIAIVTGASSGIGAGCAKELANAGATVVVNYPAASSKAMAEQVVANVAANGDHAISYQCDVSKEDEVKKMFADVVAQFGTVDILINNAGLQRDAKFVDMTLEQWNFVLGVNLTGQFLCAREAIKEFLRRGVNGKSKSAGKIICMSSVHELIPWAGHANYAASKGGVSLMMKSIAQEYAPMKIRINSIAPGAIQTPINRDAWDIAANLQKLLTLIPNKRIGQVEDIGKAAVWLASDDADYVNGTTLFVDGGMTLYPGFADNG
jgi:glucose 1-dehydrogenase